jgi:hypothetical protein
MLFLISVAVRQLASDFRPILQAAVDLNIGLGIHGGPGSYMVGGISDYTETFVLTHIFRAAEPATAGFSADGV